MWQLRLFLLSLLLVIACIHGYNFLCSRTSPRSIVRPYRTRIFSEANNETPINNESPAVDEPKGSGIGAYYQEVLSVLAKVPFAE